MKNIDNAFGGCQRLEDFYCRVKNVPSTSPDVFRNTFIEQVTLHVPASARNEYMETTPWSNFYKIIGDMPEPPELEKCATPTISYENGKLTFSCETEGAVCQSTITDTDITSYSDNEILLSATYNISVLATKTGYDDSDVATATLCWIDAEPRTEGLDEDAITEVKALPVLIQTQGGNITIQSAAEGTSITIYSIDGKQYGSAIAEKDSTTISTSLQSGSVAVVKIGEKAVKVLVK